MEGMKQRGLLSSKEDVAALFGNVQTIHAVHTDLLHVVSSCSINLTLTLSSDTGDHR